MGEYIMLDRQQIKLGTYEDLFYVRLEQLRDWIAAGRATADGTLPAEYLAGGFRFRFPFPDEDAAAALGADLGHYDRGYTVAAPYDLVRGLEHDQASVTVWAAGYVWGMTAENAGGHVALRVPCPATGAGAELVSYAPNGHQVQITAVKPVGVEVQTVVRCPWCRAMARLDREEAAALAAHNADAAGRDRMLAEILRRMLAGYGLEVRP